MVNYNNRPGAEKGAQIKGPFSQVEPFYHRGGVKSIFISGEKVKNTLFFIKTSDTISTNEG